MQNATEAEDMLNRVMTKDNIGITALLELKEGYLNYGNDVNMPRQQVLVSNVHIHWDPEFKDVKLIQSVMLMHELMTIMQEINPGFMVQGGRLDIFCLVKFPWMIIMNLIKIKVEVLREWTMELEVKLPGVFEVALTESFSTQE